MPAVSSQHLTARFLHRRRSDDGVDVRWQCEVPRASSSLASGVAHPPAGGAHTGAQHGEQPVALVLGAPWPRQRPVNRGGRRSAAALTLSRKSLKTGQSIRSANSTMIPVASM
jgi:hypothetical protein